MLLSYVFDDLQRISHNNGDINCLILSDIKTSPNNKKNAAFVAATRMSGTGPTSTTQINTPNTIGVRKFQSSIDQHGLLHSFCNRLTSSILGTVFIFVDTLKGTSGIIT